MSRNPHIRWESFINQTKDKPANRLLQRASAMIMKDAQPHKDLHAFDVGCGAGRDMFFLLNSGFDVTAIDRCEQAIDAVSERYTPNDVTALTLLHADMNTLHIPKNHLTNAHHAIPFCSPNNIENVMYALLDAVYSGGYFCATFFGEYDSWKEDKHIATLTELQLKQFFHHHWTVKYFENVTPFEGKTATGKVKTWHILSIIAKKI